MTERERLLKIIELEKMSSKQFAELVGIGAGTISNIASGRNNASLDVLQRVRARFPKYSAKWVYEGVGEMYSDSYSPTEDKNNEPSAVPVGKWDTEADMSVTDELPFAEITQPQSSAEGSRLDMGTKRSGSEGGITKKELQPEDATLPIEGKVGAINRIVNNSGVEYRTGNNSGALNRTGNNSGVEYRTITKIVVFYSDGTYEER